jgi:hypothetical protein
VSRFSWNLVAVPSVLRAIAVLVEQTPLVVDPRLQAGAPDAKPGSP